MDKLGEMMGKMVEHWLETLQKKVEVAGKNTTKFGCDRLFMPVEGGMFRFYQEKAWDARLKDNVYSPDIGVLLSRDGP